MDWQLVASYFTVKSTDIFHSDAFAGNKLNLGLSCLVLCAVLFVFLSILNTKLNDLRKIIYLKKKF